jgi:hypothetical protein
MPEKARRAITSAPLASAAVFLDEDKRSQLWDVLRQLIDRYVREVPTMPVAPPLDIFRTRAFAEAFSFSEPQEPAELFRRVGHTPHPAISGCSILLPEQ